MTEKGRIIFGLTVIAPAFYLLLFVLTRPFERFLPHAVDFQKWDVFAAAIFAVLGCIVSLIVVRMYPDLRAQAFFTPVPEKAAEPASEVAPTAEASE
jgi:uncharacterized membrane protein